MYAFKTLARNNYSTKGGNIEWYPPQNGVPGIWLSEAPKTYEKYYLCTKENVIYWLDECIYVAEIQGGYSVENGDVTVEDARLVQKINGWNKDFKRKFADNCYEAIKSMCAIKKYEKNFELFKQAYEAMNIVAISKIADSINPDFFKEQNAIIIRVIDEEIKDEYKILA